MADENTPGDVEGKIQLNGVQEQVKEEGNKIIDHLTKEQEAQFDPYVEKWLKYALSTDEPDIPGSEHWICEAYKAAGIEPPSSFEWFKSPQAMRVACPEAFVDRSGNICFGNHDAPWLAFYDFMLNVVGLECVKPLVPLMEIGKRCNWWIPMTETCLVSWRPSKIHMAETSNGLMHLHRTDGPAVEFPDGFTVYCLNGVRVPKEIVLTPARELDPMLIVKLQNAEVRREIIRKIGVEKVVEKLGGKVIDSGVRNGKKYELILLDLQDDQDPRPFLKMEDATFEGIYRIEGVPPETKTVDAALAFRNGTSQEPETLT